MERFCQKYCCNLPHQHFETFRILCQTLGLGVYLLNKMCQCSQFCGLLYKPKQSEAFARTRRQPLAGQHSLKNYQNSKLRKIIWFICYMTNESVLSEKSCLQCKLFFSKWPYVFLTKSWKQKRRIVPVAATKQHKESRSQIQSLRIIFLQY